MNPTFSKRHRIALADLQHCPLATPARGASSGAHEASRTPQRPAWRRWVVALLAAQGLCTVSWAQQTPLNEGLASVPSRMRLGAERIELPGNENLGLIGTSYTLEVLPGFWAGPAAYGAITGQRGGLFTVGAEVAWQSPSLGPLSIGAGFYAGGGGGGSAPVGGGLMLRPHVDLMWALSPTQSIGLSWSRVRFPKTGVAGGSEAQIDSKQIGLLWSVDSYFRFLPRERLASPLRTNARTGIGFDRMQALAGFYRPSRGLARLDGGGDLPRDIGFAGARLEQALDDGFYWGLEAAGAASGGVSGYAEYLATLGVESLIGGESLAVGARLALGMGGGGNVDTGGGLLWKAGAYGIVRLASDLGLTIEGGVARAPQGNFRARYGAVAFTWILDDRIDSTAPARITRMEWVGGIERYKAARRDGSVRALQAVSLRVNRELTPGIYLSAQAHSATGGGAGGYSVGLLGMGVRREFGRWHAGAEALAGAAGGGGVDTAGGALVQPMAYVGYDLTPGVALRLGAGRIQALRGPLKADVVEMSLAFTFGVASRGYR